MKRKNFLMYAILIALVTMVSCTSHKATQKSSTGGTLSAQANERANQCRYTVQEPYLSSWEKNISQQNLIASLKKRITLLEEHQQQQGTSLHQIPPMTVEPLAQTGIYKPYDRCINQLDVKTPEGLKAENGKQETEIVSLQKKVTELMQNLRPTR